MSDTISRRSMMTSPPLVMMMLVGIALLIAALVMWSWRGADWGAFVWLAVSVALVAIRTPHLVRNHTNQIVVRRADRLELWMFTGVCLAGLVLPLIHLTTGLFAPADYLLPDWATATGAALQVPVLWLFWRSHADLGRNWSLALEVRRGPRPRHARRLRLRPPSNVRRDGAVGAVPAVAHPQLDRRVPRDPGLRRLVCCSHPARGSDVARALRCRLRRLCRPHPAYLPRSSNANGVRPEWWFLKP